MSERRFSTPRETLRTMRDQFDRVEHAISTSQNHQKHDQRHPGRIAALMAEADKYLQQAAWFLTAIPEDKETFADKVYLVGFENTLRLAHKCMVMAVMDLPIMIGEDRREISRKAMDTVNQQRKGLGDHIEELAQTTQFDTMLAGHSDWLGDPTPPKDLWPELYHVLDREGLEPKECGDTLENGWIEYDQGKRITYKNFRERIRLARQPPKR
jgi:hypothetical protein